MGMIENYVLSGLFSVDHFFYTWPCLSSQLLTSHFLFNYPRFQVVPTPCSNSRRLDKKGLFFFFFFFLLQELLVNNLPLLLSQCVCWRLICMETTQVYVTCSIVFWGFFFHFPSKVHLSFRFLSILLCGLPGRQSPQFGRFSLFFIDYHLFCSYYYYYYFTHLVVFHTCVSWWFSTGVWVTASLLRSLGLFWVFWSISAMI